MKHLFSLVLTAILLCDCSADDASFTAVDAVQGKRIALTYDDAPLRDGILFSGRKRTDTLIENLSVARSGPVAFFVTTQGLDKYEGAARIQAYDKAGHRIANHSDTHKWASHTSTTDYIADIDRAEAKLGDLENRRNWYRFPYLDEGGAGIAHRDLIKRDALRKALEDRGLVSGYVTIDTYDWHLQSLWKKAVLADAEVDKAALFKVYKDMILDAAEYYDRLALEVLGRRPAQVLLLHENDLAALFAKDLIEALRKNGWTIIDPDVAYADALAKLIPKTGFSGMGRISALAKDAGLSGDDVFKHWSASREAIETRVSEARVFTLPEDQ